MLRVNTMIDRVNDDKKYYKKPLRLATVFTEKMFYNGFGENVLNKQLWWYVF